MWRYAFGKVFLNAPFWGQNDAFMTQNDPLLKLFWDDYSLLAWPDPKANAHVRRYSVKVDFKHHIISDLAEFNPEKIILFGSHARGNWDEESDIDIDRKSVV